MLNYKEMDNTNIPNGLPYEQLAKLGIDQHLADSLPEDVKRNLSRGELTPLMEVSVKATNGIVVTMPMKLQLVAGKNGEPILMAYPAKRDLTLLSAEALHLSQYEIERLFKGEVIQKTIDINSQKQENFLQMDPETKSLLMKRVSDVRMDARLRDIEKIDDVELGQQQKQAAREGRPIELNVGGEKVSVGVDLREPQGFKVVRGDMKEWDRQKQMKYDFAHPEYVGLVKTEQNRWEYQQVIDRQSYERAIKLDSQDKVSQGRKL